MTVLKMFKAMNYKSVILLTIGLLVFATVQAQQVSEKRTFRKINVC